MKITILGYGTFGSAIASRLVLKGHDILVNEVMGSEVILVATPSAKVVEALLERKEGINTQRIIICSKGFSKDGDFLSDALKKEFPDNQIYFLYGPTLADGLVRGDLSAMVLAGGEGKEILKDQIESENLIIELSDDVIGVQVGSTMKNVITIFLGIIEGAGHGENTRAYVFTKGLEEIKEMGVALGAQSDTFMGLTCVGDISLISTNRLLGVEIGKGEKLEDIMSRVKHTQEGMSTIKNFKMISEKIGVDLPFARILYSIIFEGASIDEAIKKIR